MTLEERSESLKSFSDDLSINCILISLMAGSTGLNLVSANNVILVDPWWNPAIEEQAIDRVHRIGQIKFVNVHKFISIDSVEEKMLKVQNRKKYLVNSLFDCDKQEMKRKNLEDFKEIFDSVFEDYNLC